VTEDSGRSGAPKSFARLRRHLAEIHDLVKITSLLHWDQHVTMPPGGAAARTEQLALIARLVHERLVSTETERLLEECRPYEESLPYESDDASIVRVARRDFEKASPVPLDLRSELARAGSAGYEAWRDARARSDYESFRPYLERNLELKQRYLDCFERPREDYDILLDDYERGMTTAEVRVVFDRLKDELVPLIVAAGDAGARDDVLEQPFPIDVQREVCLDVLEAFGYSPQSWRLDPTEHPFASGTAISDIRITTRYHDRGLASLFASMHEFGHGLYERQVGESLARTPLARGASLGMHESQSRMWENLVGRSREFCSWVLPRLQRAFPEQLDDVDCDRFYAAVNRVRPSLIRIHADEATYNLHIILRFELEQDLIAGRVGLAELPDAWNAKMLDYLGLEPPDEAHGVLQDVHWSGGSLGYFPTYSLGNVISVQLWQRIGSDIPDLYESLERGEFAPLREWLREHVHRHGRKFTTQELLERVVGGALDPEPYLRYLKHKHVSAVA
jgi:carboxypeptidase Taq